VAKTTFTLEAEQIEQLQEAMANYAGHAGKVIDEVLHKQGAELIKDGIMQLLPASGRTWKGKKPAARSAKPFTQENGSLSVTILTKSAYDYLYFPDDGTTTKNHIGFHGKPREFMRKGAKNQTARIMDLCINRLSKEMGE
jgi:HK97 gp10 family phage protein